MIIKPRFNDKLSVLGDVIYPLISGLFASYFSVLILFVNEVKDSPEKSFFKYIEHFNKWPVLSEFCVAVCTYFLLRFFVKDRRIAAAISPLPILLLGLLNGYVFLFRGSEVNAGDLASIKTALNVATQYRFVTLIPFMTLIIPYVCFVLAVCSFKFSNSNLSFRYRVHLSFPLIAAALCLVCFVSNRVDSRMVFLWKNEGSKYNGMINNIALSFDALSIDVPEGYSPMYFDDNVQGESISAESRDLPNVIIIMNESFADITCHNEFYNDSYADPLPYFHSLANDPEHAYLGYAFSSVYGGGTSISEFEMLTGLTSAFLPNNISPYVMYVNKDVYSIPWMLKEHGYTTIGMHPYNATGWNRVSAYPYMGFDEMYFIDDFTYDENALMRGYMTDECAYLNMIETIETHKLNSDAPVFTFMVTMQNHGGYDTNLETMVIDEYVPGCVTENVFATLLSKSDSALEMLFNYLSQQDEEYVVMMFGDHLPSIPSFVSNSNGSLAMLVPYVVWDNKGIDYASLSGFTPCEYSSINYLGLLTLKATNIPLSPYFQLISDIHENVPAITSRLYYSYELGSYDFISNLDLDSSESDAILEYRYLVYNSLFESNDNRHVWN